MKAEEKKIVEDVEGAVDFHKSLLVYIELWVVSRVISLSCCLSLSMASGNAPASSREYRDRRGTGAETPAGQPDHRLDSVVG